jgi:TPR repeat protein
MLTRPPFYSYHGRHRYSAAVTISPVFRWGRVVGLLALLHATTAVAATVSFDEGVRAFEGGNHATALRLFRAEADRGHAGARYYLGRMHLLGEGVSADYKRAAEYFLAAATRGNINAQFYLGTMYYRGVGVSKDYTKALLWYRRAADQGDRAAQFSLGVINLAGEGVPKDTVQALMWFDLAAQSGLRSAAQFKELLARSMTPEEIAEAGRRARDRRRQPAKP